MHIPTPVFDVPGFAYGKKRLGVGRTCVNDTVFIQKSEIAEEAFVQEKTGP
jgi:hypothetical protein